MKKNNLELSAEVMQDIHKALHDGRRKTITLQNKKIPIQPFGDDNREIVLNNIIFTKFADNVQNNSTLKATYVIDKGKYPNNWKVVIDNKIFKNKREYFKYLRDVR